MLESSRLSHSRATWEAPLSAWLILVLGLMMLDCVSNSHSVFPFLKPATPSVRITPVALASGSPSAPMNPQCSEIWSEGHE